MKKNRMVLFVAGAAVLATSAIGLAQSEGSQWTEHRFAKRVIAGIEARLNVTEAQREEAKAILKTEEPTIIALAAQAKQEREAITALPAYNQAEVAEIAQKYSATNTAIIVERAKVRLQLRAILTPAQLEQLEKFKALNDDKFDERLDMVIDSL